MEDPTTAIIAGIAAVIALGAMIAAFWQASEAKKAREDAKAARDEAKGSEARALAAAERSAAAQEEQAALARAEAARWVPPWTAAKERRNGATTWLLTLRGDATWSDVEWEYVPGEAQPHDADLPTTVHPGDAVQWSFFSSISGPSQTTIVVRGMPAEDPDGPRQQRFTLTR